MPTTSQEIRLTQEQLRALTDALDPKSLRRALTGALRAAANVIRKDAAARVRACTQYRIRAVASAIKARVNKKLDGSYVIVSTQGDEFMTTVTRRRKAGIMVVRKPLAYWFENGVKRDRRGAIKPVEFLKKADIAKRKEAEAMLGAAFEKHVAREAAKLMKQ